MVRRARRVRVVNAPSTRSNGHLRSFRRHALLAAGLTFCVAACGSASAASRPSAPSTIGGVGVLPRNVVAEAPQTTAPAPSTAPTTTAAATTTTEIATTTMTVPVTETTVEAETTTVAPALVLKSIAPVGQRSAGNRVLMIGDSVLAGTSSRYSNDMCETMVPLGWQVEVDAEVGRFVDFADRVLDKRASAGWDAAVIFLGSNYGEDQGLYASLLESAVDRLSPMPVVLV